VIPAAIIIGREIVISALREWMAEIGQRTTVAVANIAKWKTALQMIGIGFLVWYTPNASPIIVIIGYVTLYFATVLTLWTMIVYLYASRKAFEE
jgi:CDP-diacylglycerol--glycerol-3-phosphate 3-phosphatidyltransferase